MADDLHFLTIAEAARRIRAGALSPVALVEAVLGRIAALDGRVNSHIRVLGEAALAEAQAAASEIAAGRWKGPLHGIPIGLKDIFETAGVATTGNSAVLRDHVPAADAETVARLRRAGAIIVGKHSCYEFATGGTSFDLPWPPARNPWNLGHDPGGSSSGSGAAVAAGMCLGAMGSDTGGSIRGPAAWCGLAGLKPTYGLLSRRGVLPLAFSLDHAGPMTWTSEDCALMLQVLAGHDPQDPGSADVVVPDYTAALEGGVAGLRIGVVRHFYEDDASVGEAAAALEAALARFSAMGAKLRDVTLAPLGFYDAVCATIVRGESYAVHEAWLTATPEKYGEIGWRRLVGGKFLRATDYVNAQRHRARLIRELGAVMQEVDLLVMPTRPTGAPTIGALDAHRNNPSLTRPFNVTGSPALSVCDGFAANGLPLSLQIVGRPFEDHLVLRAGHAFERAAGLREARPVLTAGAPLPPPPAVPRDDAAALPGIAADVEKIAAQMRAALPGACEPAVALRLDHPI